MSVYVISDNVVSPIGFSTETNFNALLQNQSALELHNKPNFSDTEFWAAILSNDLIDKEFIKFNNNKAYTRFEKLCIISINDALGKSDIEADSERTLLILSTTKGNIDCLEADLHRSKLWVSADNIGEYFGFKNKPLTISLACISGVAALITGYRMLLANEYDNVVICGADIFSRFVLTGFQSFQAISNKPCRPFDVDRNGISLGEAVGTIIVTKTKPSKSFYSIEILGGAITNDANHISGPSKEAIGLTDAINDALRISGLTSDEIDFVSAHGTGTIYNDNMEALALTKTGLNDKPINSFKGYFGHTLGAAGIIESIMTFKSMQESALIRSLGYENPGTPNQINVTRANSKNVIKYALKTSSGFAGGNAAIIFASV